MLHFSNPTIMPLEAITLQGFSAKEGPDPIGRFGTGLKYTIAGLLRLGAEISVETNGSTFLFSKESKTVRGKEFDQVLMTQLFPGGNEQVRELGFTTDLGRHWEPWMFYRELWSNCMDEGGTYGIGRGNDPAEGSTRILVTGLDNYFYEEHKFILPQQQVLFDVPHYGQIVKSNFGAGPSSVYFQRIAVAQTKPSLYTYNITGSIGLTEDRTLPEYHMHIRLGEIIAACTDKKIIESILTAGNKDLLEADLTFYTSDMSREFKEVFEELWKTKPHSLGRRWGEMAAAIFKADRKSRTFTPSIVELEKFSKAKHFIEGLGFTEFTGNFYFVENDEGVYAFVEGNDIYITRRCFDNGTQFLAQTLIEEYMHAVQDLGDYTRAFQDFLLGKLVALGEELRGEPL